MVVESWNVMGTYVDTPILTVELAVKPVPLIVTVALLPPVKLTGLGEMLVMAGVTLSLNFVSGATGATSLDGTLTVGTDIAAQLPLAIASFDIEPENLAGDGVIQADQARLSDGAMRARSFDQTLGVAGLLADLAQQGG